MGARGFVSSEWFKLSATARVVAGARTLIVECSARAAVIWAVDSGARAVILAGRKHALDIDASRGASIVEPRSGVASLRVVISSVVGMVAARSAAVAGAAVEARAAEDLFPVDSFPSVEWAALSAGAAASGLEASASFNSVELGIT